MPPACASSASRRTQSGGSLFELGELGLPVVSWREREGGLAFDLLSSAAQPVTTGHANGVITLDLAESDDAHRVARREQLAEPYRTVLGHLRHEIGHYYWPILVDRDEKLERSRELFGDEREDYDAALERHYRRAPRPTGTTAASAPTRPCTPPRTGPRPSPTTSTSATACRPRPPTGSGCSGRRAPLPRAWSPSSPRARAGERDFDRPARHLAPAHLRAQRDQPQHRPQRPLPVHPLARPWSRSSPSSTSSSTPERSPDRDVHRPPPRVGA